jgi:TonB family protein
MSAGEIARQSAPRRRATRWPALAAWRRERGRFPLLVALVALVHAVLIFGAGLSLMRAPRIMGEPEGSKQGLSVELVDAADLESTSTVAFEPPTPPGVAAPAPPPTPLQPPPQAQEAQPAPPEPQPKPAPEQSWATTASIDRETPAAPPAEGPTEEPVEKAQPKEAKKAKEAKETKEARDAKETKDTKEKAKPERDRLQLTMPNLPNPTFVPGGRATAASRPPNITRSGENDDFGRGVIRALKQTMPQVSWVGRVSIRLLLNEKGNIQEVELVRSGGDPLMDQNVVFAARQANFPIPPVNSTVADRTFYVTYVYHY